MHSIYATLVSQICVNLVWENICLMSIKFTKSSNFIPEYPPLSIRFVDYGVKCSVGLATSQSQHV